MRPKHLVQSRNYIIPNTSAVIRPSLFTRYSIHYLNKFDLVFSFTAYSGNLVSTLMKDSFLSICGKNLIHMFRYDDETDHKLSQFTRVLLRCRQLTIPSPSNPIFSFFSNFNFFLPLFIRLVPNRARRIKPKENFPRAQFVCGAVAVLEVFNPIRMIIFVAHETEALVFTQFD